MALDRLEYPRKHGAGVTRRGILTKAPLAALPFIVTPKKALGLEPPPPTPIDWRWTPNTPVTVENLNALIDAINERGR